MNGHAHLVKDWAELARQTQYSAWRFAEVLGISEHHARRVVQERLGKSVHLFLEEMRLKDGLEMLKRGELVKKVARDLGYAEPANFCRAFKNRYGKSPLQFLSVLQRSERQNVR